MEPQEPSQPSVAKICTRCSEINFDKLLSKPSDGPNLGRIALYDKGICDLCDFFFDVLPEEIKQGDYVYFTYRLRSRRSRDYGTKPEFLRSDKNSYTINTLEQTNIRFKSKTLNETWPAVDSLVLCLDPSPRDPMNHVLDGPGIPYILESNQSNPWFKPLKNCIDFEVAKEWLGLCTMQHKKRCRVVVDADYDGPSRLIDCSSRRVSPAKKAEYVTLSYVWGSVANSPDNSQVDPNSWMLPDDLPKTIEDAISVTKELGYRFLWIDRYCIDRSDPSAFIEEVQHMDRVYQNSVLTIIDAGGKDPYCGLPGVRPDSRQPRQPSVCIGDLKFISTSQRPEWDIKRSAWSSRGWTYQEGLLSRRRLIFTPNQLYFECQGVYCREALNFPKDSLISLHVGEQLHPDFRQPGKLGAFPSQVVGDDTTQIYDRLTEYTTRKLSRDDDILNGFSGLFRYMEKSEVSIGHLWGLPYERLYSNPRLPFENIRSFDGGTVTFETSICWTIPKPSPRRKGFPSWSFAGWYGAVEWSWPRTPPGHLGRFRLGIEVKSEEDGWIGGKELNRAYSTLIIRPLAIHPVIRVSAHTTKVTREPSEYDTDIFKPTFRIGNTNTECYSTTTDDLGEKGDYLALWLWFAQYWNTHGCLILKRGRGDVWGRVAHGNFGEFEHSDVKVAVETILLG